MRDMTLVKILFLSHMFPNQVEPLNSVFVAEKAKALSGYCNIQIIAPVPYFPLLRRKAPRYKENFEGLDVLHPRYLTLPKKLFFFRWMFYYLQVKKNIESCLQDVDIINVEWVYPDCYVAVKIASRHGKKVVVTVHGNEAIGYLESAPVRQIHARTLRLADHVIAVSRELKHKLVDAYGIEASRITVVPNGVDVNKIPAISRETAREKLGLQEVEGVICVCIARLSEEKALNVMLDAFSLCGEAHKLFILGDGPLKHSLKQQAADRKIAHRVFFAGPVQHKDVFLWLSAADFFCLSSKREGCPVVVHEALACGIPVISTSVGGVPDIVEDARYGCLCPIGSAEEFACALKQATSIQWDQAIIAEHGRQFTWENTARAMVKIFETVSAQPSAADAS